VRGVQTHKKKEIEMVKTVKRIMPALIVALAVLLGSIAPAMEALSSTKCQRMTTGRLKFWMHVANPSRPRK
jgi:hypothetical protein